MSNGVPCNFHTHTIFCDGNDTPEELVSEAIRLGCAAIGFSGHSFTPFDKSYCMSEEKTKEYKSEIKRLKEKYRDKIAICLGVEQDFFSPCPTDEYDYVIGSVHYVKKNGEYLPVDESREIFEENVMRHYGGDYLAFCEDYYALVAELYTRTRCDVVGHFDLVTKFNEGDELFDTDSPRYRRAADNALYALKDCGAVFEINSGAVARGLRSEPYPQRRILEKIRMLGLKTMKNSDCHSKELLLFGL